MNDLIVARLDKARLILAEARSLEDVKRVVDLAAAAQTYARRQQLGAEAETYARELRLDAERRLGEMLRESAERGERITRETARSSSALELDRPASLAELGIDKKTSARAQKLADMTPERFESIKAGERTVTSAFREMRAEEIARTVSLPDAKYRVIYADPPWSYGNTQPDYHTEQRDHYPVMTLTDICAMDVASLAEDNAALFLWVTSPILEESFQVIRAWGFKYKASFVWDKIKHNMGHYNSVRHEFLLICTRGSGTPEVPRLFDSVVSQERTEHSAKPAIFYEMIETLYPSGKKLEMFLRGEPREGWDGFGHQATARAA